MPSASARLRHPAQARVATYAPALAINAVVISAVAVWHHDILHVLALIRHHCA